MNNNSQTVKWGIIGIGALSERFLAPGISAVEGSELTAVCSRDAKRARDFADRHDVPLAFDDYSTMLASDIDVVYIASPNGLHHPHAIAALQAGMHVLIDKPLALTVEHGKEIVQIARDANLLAGVGYQARHKATNAAARGAIIGGKLGNLANIQMFVGAGKDVFPFDSWRADSGLAGGGTLLNQGTHAVDLIEWVSGQKIVEVAALSQSETLEEVFAAVCRLEGGALASIVCDQVMSGTRRDWLAVGDAGWLEGIAAMSGAAGDKMLLHAGGETTELASSAVGAYQQQLDDMAQAIRGNAPLNGSADDGLRAVVVVEALYQSARERRAITVS
jgi:predicted dehydrogenase